uniref:Uncharacterized protein n=1 Tax=Chaetoceros debilis TaxID=122233 RepID=A0A7S3Q266_9STRA
MLRRKIPEILKRNKHRVFLHQETDTGDSRDPESGCHRQRLSSTGGKCRSKKRKMAFALLLASSIIVGIVVRKSLPVHYYNLSEEKNDGDLVVPKIEETHAVKKTNIKIKGPEDERVKMLVDELQSLVPDRIKSRYASLPSPPWPQLDHRISKAVLNGDLIGFNPSKPLAEMHKNTIVTAYYEFTSKHSPGEYERWFERILGASEPMIIFLEPGSRWVDFVAKKRTHAPTILAQISFGEGIMSTTFTKDFWDFMFSIDTEAKVHRGSNVYKVWNEKLIYMYAATMLNPFETPGFAWMDAGYFRQITPELGKPIIKVNITEDGIGENELVLLHVRDDPISAVARVNIAGNAFLGTSDSFLNFYPKYYETFWDWISIEKFIGSDQFVMTETCRRFRSHCHPFFPGSFRQWFAMWEMMQGKKDYVTVSKKYIFEDKPTSPKEVPNGKRVTYCKGEIVTFETNEPVC